LDYYRKKIITANSQYAKINRERDRGRQKERDRSEIESKRERGKEGETKCEQKKGGDQTGAEEK